MRAVASVRGPGEELNPGPPVEPAPGGERDPAARRRARTSRCCSSSARPRRASWAACGCSPAAPSTREEGDGDGAHRAGRRPRAARGGLRSSSPDPPSSSSSRAGSRPAMVQIRFDTHFFLATLPEGQEPAVDGEECVDLGWFTPQGALEAHDARRDPARLPDDQAPRAAARVRVRRGAARARPRPRCCRSSRASWSRARSPASCCPGDGPGYCGALDAGGRARQPRPLLRRRSRG